MSHVFPTSFPTIRSGALRVGDRLLSINGQSLDKRTVEDARRLLAHSDINVTLEITPAHNFIDQPGFSPMDECKFFHYHNPTVLVSL